MTSLSIDPGRLASGRPQVPNNFGPTLLLGFGFLLLPILVGAPILIVGLARIRDAHGDLALRWLSLRLSSLQAWLRFQL